MNQTKIERMKELVQRLSEAAFAYEQQDQEIMSNYEYDQLYDELSALEQESGVIMAGSVTQKVGYEIASSLPKVTHSSRMLSLDKTKEVSRLKEFVTSREGLLSWKLDGLTIVCTYEEGRLVQAVTRGSGEIGEDVTNNAKTFKNLPITISYKGRLVIRGEAVITYSEFEKINEKLPVEEKYKNPRNLCSGSVRQLNSAITATRNVRLYAFAIVDGGEVFENKSDQLEWLTNQGFEVVEYHKVTAENIEAVVAYFAEAIHKQDFASDGLVLTYDHIAYSRALGTTAKFPKDAIAFKWQDEVKETQIKEIEWNTSRTGLINPVAIFEAVDLEGTTVERASVHNLSILEELKLGIGDTVKVYKANMIIPQIAENLSGTGPVEVPSLCPVCGAETVIKQDKTAKSLYCPNGNCKAQRLKAFEHFASRDAMNIEGLSEATIAKFIEQGFLEDIVSLYDLGSYQHQIEALEGFGAKSYERLMKSVEKSRQTTLSRLLYGLGILQVGPMNAKLVCKHFKDNFEAIQKATVEELTSIEGIGPVIAKEIHNYFALEANRNMMDRLIQQLNIEQMEEVDVSGSPIVDKTFVVTGDVNHFANRKALQAEIEKLGGKVTGSVSKKTDYLINNDSHSPSSKNKKAQELGIPILTEDEFLKLIGR